MSLHFRGPLHLKQLAVYKLNGLQKQGLPLAPSRIHGHRHLHKRYVGPDTINEPIGDNLADDNVEDRSKVVHEALDGILYTTIDFGSNRAEP